MTEYTAEQVRRAAVLLGTSALDHRIRGYLEDYAALLGAQAQPVDDAVVAEAIRTLSITSKAPHYVGVIEDAYRAKCAEAQHMTALFKCECVSHDETRAEHDEARAEVDRLREVHGNLCAVIFRDGGQRAAELGNDAGVAAEAVVIEAFAELERLDSWDGLMELLDKHWPASMCPTTHDTEEHLRDPGPRIVALIRWIDELRAAVKRLETERDEARAEVDRLREVLCKLADGGQGAAEGVVAEMFAEVERLTKRVRLRDGLLEVNVFNDEARADVKRLTIERDKMYDGYNAMIAARDTARAKVKLLTDELDEMRAERMELYDRVAELETENE